MVETLAIQRSNRRVKYTEANGINMTIINKKKTYIADRQPNIISRQGLNLCVNNARRCTVFMILHHRVTNTMEC
jgi:hypothetical protein